MAKKEVNIKIRADGKDAENGIKKVTAELNKLNKQQDGLNKLSKAFKGTFIAGATVTAIKKTAEAINSTVEAYRTQLQAEKQLEVAAKNNPYLNGESINELKAYASELQKTTAVGDEKLIPMMSQLASAGRTQSEIMKIMQTALDVSASGMMSLDSAVTQLNATYNGSIGLMGRQVGELKSLTKEELESGKAVDIMAQKYKGMAEEIANTVGSADKLNNAWGDLKEGIGYSFNNMVAPVQNFFATVIQGWADSIQNANAYKEALKDFATGKVTESALDTLIKNKKAELDALDVQKEERNKALNEVSSTGNKNWSSSTKTMYADYMAKQTDDLKKNTEGFIEWIHEQQNAYDEELAMLKKYQEEKKRIQGYKDSADQTKKEADITNQINNILQDETIQNYDEQIKKLYELKDAYEELTGSKIENEEAFNEKVMELMTLQMDTIKANSSEEVEIKKSSYQDIISSVDNYTVKYCDLMSKTLSLAKEYADSEYEYQSKVLEKQYKEGYLTEEEYAQKSEELEKEAAERKYQIQMWEWGMNIAQCLTNTALSVTRAFAEGGPYAGPALAAISAAMGAVQLGIITANKPIKGYSQGGFITDPNDDQIASVKTGEYVLTYQQQKNLLALTNGQNGGINMPVYIENTQAERITADVTQDGEALRILIRQNVDADLRDGYFNNGLKAANDSMNGIRYR